MTCDVRTICSSIAQPLLDQLVCLKHGLEGQLEAYTAEMYIFLISTKHLLMTSEWNMLLIKLMQLSAFCFVVKY